MRKEKIIIGPPSEELLRLEEMGELVICELKHLQNLNEQEIEAALTEEPAVWQYKHICIDARKLPQAYFERMIAKANGEPVVIASTKRLLIRESVSEDAKAFQQLYVDEEVQRFVEIPPIAQLMTEEALDDELLAYETYIEQYAKNQYGFYEYGMWSVVEKESGKVIGRMGLELQEVEGQEECGENTSFENTLALGYALLPEYRGKGFAYEACIAILDYCIECGYATEVFVKIDDKNIKSKKLFQKLQKYSRMTLRKTNTKG